jgi:hypothetical protein
MEKKIIRCKCGADMVKVDNHVICEKYYEHIKQGIKQQQQIIDELQSYDDEDEI